ncbi:hypothetical protein J6590_103922 [Homalodisca vitripennis]|nr:hypothetical protein J6590_103922 [Homalodisca vitripennis]
MPAIFDAPDIYQRITSKGRQNSSWTDNTNWRVEFPRRTWLPMRLINVQKRVFCIDSL